MSWQLRTKDFLLAGALIPSGVALAWVATHHYFFQHFGDTDLWYRTELFSGETALCDPNMGACSAWFDAAMPSPWEWLSYHLTKSVTYYVLLASALVIPAAFVMWIGVGFLTWYGGRSASRRTLRVTWAITAVAGLWISIYVIAANWSPQQRVEGDVEANASTVAPLPPIAAAASPVTTSGGHAAELNDMLESMTNRQLIAFAPFIRNCGPARTEQRRQARQLVTIRLLQLSGYELQMAALLIRDGQCGLDQF